ncbi:nonstructural protein [Embossos virus]|uniref:Nonstructural protein n=1 Tax=Embossos virus TaxID=2767008 RepID=A0A7G8PYJ7_9VIRU|nr:nonstructural protein [Embossos virus]QNJ99603.1 nonstructural protein [Embossos virus]
MLKSTENYFMYDYPHLYPGPTNRLSYVSFRAYNRVQSYPIVKYKTMEIQCINFKPTGKSHDNLSKYYIRGELPRHWGDEFGLIRYPAFETFDGMMAELTPALHMDRHSPYHLNINEALHWPTRTKTFAPIKAHSMKDPNPLFMKNLEASVIYQSVSKGVDFDKMLMQFHRKIVFRASVLGLKVENFPGNDLLKECAVVLCIMLINASKFDKIWFGHTTETMRILDKYEEKIRTMCPELLGNGKWTPVPAPEIIVFRNM